MSVIPPKADITKSERYVRFVPKADITRPTLQRSSLLLRSWRILSRGLKGTACILRSCDAARPHQILRSLALAASRSGMRTLSLHDATSRVRCVALRLGQQASTIAEGAPSLPPR